MKDNSILKHLEESGFLKSVQDGLANAGEKHKIIQQSKRNASPGVSAEGLASFANAEENLSRKESEDLIANTLKLLATLNSTVMSVLNESRMDLSSFSAGLNGFIGSIRNKSIEDLTPQNLEDLTKILQVLQQPESVKMLTKKLWDHKDIITRLQAVTVSQVATAVKVLQSQDKELRITPSMNATELSGDLLALMSRFMKDNEDVARRYLSPICNKYGQAKDLTVYTWEDLTTIVNILKKYKYAVSINTRGISDMASTPKGNPVSTSSFDEPGEIGDIVRGIQKEPSTLKDLVQYFQKHNPQTYEKLLDKYSGKSGN